MAEAQDASGLLGVTPAGEGWAHGFLPAEDLLAEDAADILEDRARHLHGPCDGCGFLYYTESTEPRPPCPNCGHRAAPGDRDR